MKTDRRAGLYVHTPFCLRKCRYCDFASSVPNEDFRAAYTKRLISEILSYKDKNVLLDTVFFGGGTPSLLTERELDGIMDAIRSSFRLSPRAEITAEVNPGTLDEEKLAAFLSEGFNRFSIGLQSIHEKELKKLGRIHTFEDFLEVYKMMRSRGVGNISVDLMFGIPEQSVKSFEKTLSVIKALSPEHISAYGLIIEEGTPFYNERKSLKLPDEEDEREMYFLASSVLSESGYSHYEISNFAKVGFECKHNLKYWSLEDYIGVGLAAHSYFEGAHFSNPKDQGKYLSGLADAHERLSDDDVAFEYAMLRLRTSYGISFAEYKKRTGSDFLTEERRERIDFYKARGLLVCDENRLALTAEGFYLSNTVISDLL